MQTTNQESVITQSGANRRSGQVSVTPTVVRTAPGRDTTSGLADAGGPYIRWVLKRLHALDEAYTGYTAGSLSKDLWDSKSAALSMLFSDSVISVWRNVSERYSAGFIAEVERLLDRRY